MTGTVQVWLPFPPSVNGLFAHGNVNGKIRRFPTKQYKAWRKTASVLLMAARIKQFAEPVIVKLHLSPPDNRARDADNFTKGPLDSLVEAGVLKGDDNRYVRAVLPMWMPSSKAPGVMVEIRPVREAARPILTPAERTALDRLRRGGVRLLGPAGRITITLKSLVDKGYVRELPGLFPGHPQGFIAAD